MTVIPPNQILLTGDKATGPLGLGHYVRNLRHRLAWQDKHRQFVMLADAQTGDAHVLDVALDYLAIGIDPQRSTIFVQSQVPELKELADCYARFCAKTLQLNEHTAAHGVADITALKTRLVPTADPRQAALVEQGNALVRSINQRAGAQVLVEALPVLAAQARNRVALDSIAHALPLAAGPDAIHGAVQALITDPKRAGTRAPGDVDHNEVFFFLDAFETDIHFLDDLKSKYRRGGLSDVVIRHHLEACLQDALEPIRERRNALASKPEEVRDLLRQGSERARAVVAETLSEVRRTLSV
ncbi:tryptophan--tRNA ligase [Silvimonas amylolytica]|uniref:Tryptophan--tRNA ligase n=1 Tax=Silvimonas amylolytica TaxID=449663 RepID=A0ABQ2PNQ8_9NEIS|nr:tryptophan--tRNA ligase [Silvimonas amylolytica]GGP27260.1 tryptophan--tRNA ligase [Silvimonas amylolytica]